MLWVERNRSVINMSITILVRYYRIWPLCLELYLFLVVAMIVHWKKSLISRIISTASWLLYLWLLLYLLGPARSILIRLLLLRSIATFTETRIFVCIIAFTFFSLVRCVSTELWSSLWRILIRHLFLPNIIIVLNPNLLVYLRLRMLPVIWNRLIYLIYMILFFTLQVRCALVPVRIMKI